MLERSCGSPDDLHGVVVRVVVDAHHEHGGVGTGGGDDHTLSSALQVSLGVRGQRSVSVMIHNYSIPPTYIMKLNKIDT